MCSIYLKLCSAVISVLLTVFHLQGCVCVCVCVCVRACVRGCVCVWFDYLRGSFIQQCRIYLGVGFLTYSLAPVVVLVENSLTGCHHKDSGISGQRHMKKGRY